MKMKKKLQAVVVTLMMVLCVTGCGAEQDEFLDYVNGDARQEVIDLEKKAKDSYTSVSGDNYKDDQTMLDELSTNALDFTKQAVEKATAMEKDLKEESVKKVHALYVSSLKDLQSGIEQLTQALENSDSDQASKANETLGKANDESAKYQEELNKLAKELDVKLETKK